MRLEFGDFVLDTAARQLLRDGKEIHLRPKAFELLELLVENRPRAVAKELLRNHLWPDTHVVEGNLHVLAGVLRKALDDDPQDPRWVRTVAGYGYAFSGTARPQASDRDGPWECCIILGQREIVLRQGENAIGRSHDLPVWVNDDSVSRRHAVIHVGEDGVFLEDCGSRNGTSRRDERIKGAVRLEDRDEVAVGGILLIVRVSHRDDHLAGGGSSRSTAPIAPQSQQEGIGPEAKGDPDASQGSGGGGELARRGAPKPQ